MACAIHGSVRNELASMNERAVESTQQHYFAIGAMMNPTSVKNRQLNLERNANAIPGYLMDHKLAFFGASGFAEVVYEKGSVMHGVVYRNVPGEHMKTLDNIERDYIRKNVTINCYAPWRENRQDKNEPSECGTMTLQNVSVYCRAPEDVEESRSTDQPPSERYLQVLMEGARHYGVAPSYIKFLEDHECRPRPSPCDFLTFPEVDGFQDKVMTREEVDREGTGKDGKPLCVRSRGRVVELMQEPETARLQSDYSESFQQHGRDVELFMAKIQYDPQFGIPSCMEEVVPEQAAITEHCFCEYMKGAGCLHKWRVVARILD